MTEKLTQTKDFVLDLLGVFFPPVAMAKLSKDYMSNMSNMILYDNLKHFIQNQDSDFEEWLKLSCNFQAESCTYYETAKMLIYTINSINDDMKLSVYSNLMRAYKNEAIPLDKSSFLRLSSILPNIFYDDLLFLKNNVTSTIKVNYENSFTGMVGAQALHQHGLLYLTNEGTVAFTRGNKELRCTPLGLEMVRCGIDFNNYYN